MEKTFSVKIPNEPYGNIDENSPSVDITYNGHRYIVFSLDSNGKFYTMEGFFDELTEFNLNDFVHEGHTFHVLDADKDTFIAALLTNEYTHDDIPAYTEELSTGETVEFDYPSNGILGVFWKPKFEYNPSVGFSDPIRVEVPLSHEELMSIISNRVADIELALASKEYSDDDKAVIQAYLDWAKAAPTNYADIAAWKIPHPTTPFY